MWFFDNPNPNPNQQANEIYETPQFIPETIAKTFHQAHQPTPEVD
jgi:hypothetical protein